MPPTAATTTTSDDAAQALAVLDGGVCHVDLLGSWRITDAHPAWIEFQATLAPAHDPRTLAALRPDTSRIQNWDTALILFLSEARAWCAARKAAFDDSALPENMRRLLGAMNAAQPRPVDKARRKNLLAVTGLATVASVREIIAFAQFVGECVLSAIYLAARPARFRWRDCLNEMQRCGAMALPIVGVISFLVGIILAYIGAVVLRQYGGDIYIADLVGLAMVREMAAMMTGIVLAGRTGGAFAAQIANMKVGEEIDALTTFGIRPVEFLVIPRIVALAVMMPLLSLYSNALGNLGGMTVGALLLKIPPPAYWIEMQSIIDLSDIMTGLIKAATYGIIVGLAGCLRGLQADRDSTGVGNAATSAVVTAMLYIIVACAVYAVLFNVLGW